MRSKSLTGGHAVVLAKGATIRFAVAADAEFLSRHVYVSEAVVSRKIALDEYVVVASAEELLGFLQLEYLWSLVPYIGLIRVLPEYRRQGLGTAMLIFVERFLYEREYRSLYSSSQADEPDPQAWHRCVGFEECGVIRGINDGIDEVFFCKTLLDD